MKEVVSWTLRSWKRVFLGFSPQHHSTVALVLNPETDSITPQYHVIFDETFSTSSTSVDDEATFTLQQWDTLLNYGYDRHESLPSPDDTETDPGPQWLLPPDAGLPLVPAIIPSTDASIQPETPSIAESSTNTEPSLNRRVRFDLPNENPSEASSPLRLRTSGRITRLPSHLRKDFQLDSHPQRTNLVTNLSKQTSFPTNQRLPRINGEVLNHQRLSTLQWNDLLSSLRGGTYGALLSYTRRHSSDGFIEEWHPSLLDRPKRLSR